jgi:hypothetical protein
VKISEKGAMPTVTTESEVPAEVAVRLESSTKRTAEAHRHTAGASG